MSPQQNLPSGGLWGNWALVALVFLVGATSQLARILMGQYTKLTVINIAAGAIGAGIASIAAVSLLTGTVGISPDLALGISGVVGWLGGNTMLALANTIEKRFGLNLNVPEKTTRDAPASPPEDQQ